MENKWNVVCIGYKLGRYTLLLGISRKCQIFLNCNILVGWRSQSKVPFNYVEVNGISRESIFCKISSYHWSVFGVNRINCQGFLQLHSEVESLFILSQKNSWNILYIYWGMFLCVAGRLPSFGHILHKPKRLGNALKVVGIPLCSGNHPGASSCSSWCLSCWTISLFLPPEALILVVLTF